MDENKKISPQSKSFIILVILAVVGTYLCLMLWSSLSLAPSNGFLGDYAPTVFNEATYGMGSLPNAAAIPTPTPLPVVDSSSWKTYTNSQYNFSFKYPTGWKVSSAKQQSGFAVIQVDPGTKYYNIKVYVSPQGFYIMGGLPTTNETIAGQPALNVRDELYGITDKGLYYTFDVGWSLSLIPQFNALVHSLQFLK